MEVDEHPQRRPLALNASVGIVIRELRKEPLAALLPPVLAADIQTGSPHLPEDVDPSRRRGGRTEDLRENGLFLSLPYVCPEPVLVN